jgi:hypothetical protein
VTELTRSSDFAADIGSRVYWLAVLVGLATGALAVGFHVIVDWMAALRGSLVAGGLDTLSAVQWVAG